MVGWEGTTVILRYSTIIGSEVVVDNRNQFAIGSNGKYFKPLFRARATQKSFNLGRITQVNWVHRTGAHPLAKMGQNALSGQFG